MWTNGCWDRQFPLIFNWLQVLLSQKFLLSALLKEVLSLFSVIIALGNFPNKSLGGKKGSMTSSDKSWVNSSVSRSSPTTDLVSFYDLYKYFRWMFTTDLDKRVSGKQTNFSILNNFPICLSISWILWFTQLINIYCVLMENICTFSAFASFPNVCSNSIMRHARAIWEI